MMEEGDANNAPSSYLGSRLATFQMTLARQVDLDPDGVAIVAPSGNFLSSLCSLLGSNIPGRIKHVFISCDLWGFIWSYWAGRKRSLYKGGQNFVYLFLINSCYRQIFFFFCGDGLSPEWSLYQGYRMGGGRGTPLHPTVVIQRLCLENINLTEEKLINCFEKIFKNQNEVKNEKIGGKK